jgi:hypothetical protein
MTYSSKIKQPYHVCVIDIGSPKLGNLGWCLMDIHNNQEFTGDNLDDLFSHLIEVSKSSGIILGLEAPLFVPLRPDLMDATKARKGEGRRPWSAGAGAQVLTMNLPIMTYIFKHLYALKPDISYFLNDHGFSAKPGEIMLFEALVSGEDKGSNHINDAQIMVYSCIPYSQLNRLPKSILEEENHTEYLNLSAAALLRCGILDDCDSLCLASPIYKPSSKPL